MITTITSLLAGAATTTRRMAGFRHILFTAFLSFALTAPYAFASCGGRNLAQGNARLPNQVHSESLVGSPIVPPPLVANPSIVGLWNLTFSSGGQVVDVAFDVWHSDGTEILNDYTPPAEGNVCLGVWQQIAPNTFVLKHPAWSFDANGNLLGTVVINEVVKVSPDGSAFAGTYTYDIYDVSGDFLEQFTGTLKATRIKPS